MRKIICSILCVLLIAPPIYAQEAVVKSLKKGNAAPFDGTLMNQEAVGEILLKLNSSEKICNAKLDREIKVQQSGCSLSIDKLKIANDFEISIYKNQKKFLQGQLDLSVKQLKKRNVRTEWWFAGGFLLGAVATVAAGYLFVKASE